MLFNRHLEQKREIPKGFLTTFEMTRKKPMTLDELYQIIEDRKRSGSKDSYVVSLFQKGRDRIAQKIGEEATEVVIAVKNRRKKEVIEEMADLWFHTLIMMSSLDIKPKDIFDEFERRKK